MDGLDKARLDAYLTREPPEVPEDIERRCMNCNTTLPTDPEKAETWEEAFTCSGQVKLVTQTYNADNDRGVLDIIGWDHLGESFEVEVAAACGDSIAHEPHKVVMADGIKEYRVCPTCGEVDIEVQM